MSVAGVLEADEGPMDIFAAWRERYAGRPHTAKSHAILLIVMGLMLALVPVFIPVFQGALSKIFGGAAGLAFVLAVDLLWFIVQNPRIQAQRNLKRQYSLGRRRAIAAVLVLIWWILLVNVGSNVILAPVVGAINVVVLISLFRFVTATDSERAIREREIEEWLEYQNAELEALEMERAEAEKVSSQRTDQERSRRFGRRK